MKPTISITKIIINVIIIVLIIAGLVLTSFFALDDLGAQVADARYWIDKTIMAVMTFLIMICVSNITEEAVKKRDEEYVQKLDNLSKNFSRICETGNNEKLKEFIELKNKRKKYEAWVVRYKRRLKHLRRESLRPELQRQLVMSPTEVWESPGGVRYTRMNYSQLISGVVDASAEEDDNDLSVHRGRLALKKALTKACMIVAMGGMVVDLVYSSLPFTPNMILPLIFKLLSALMAIYTGTTFGYVIIDRSKIVLKKKLAVYAEFNSFFDENGVEVKPLAVDIPIDSDVEKIKRDLSES